MQLLGLNVVEAHFLFALISALVDDVAIATDIQNAPERRTKVAASFVSTYRTHVVLAGGFFTIVLFESHVCDSPTEKSHLILTRTLYNGFKFKLVHSWVHAPEVTFLPV